MAEDGQAVADGFTLLETLIAAFVLGLILSAVLGSYRAVTSSITSLEPRIALEQNGRFLVQRLSRQLRCAYGGHVNPARMSSLLLRSTQSPDVRTKRPPLFRADPGSTEEAVLQFVTTSSHLSRKSTAGGLALVSYKVDTGRHALLTCEELYGRCRQDDDVARDWRVVLEDVQGIEVSFFDGVDWQTQWNSDAAGGLPRAVQIKLVLQSSQDPRPCSCTSVVALWRGAPGKPGLDLPRPSTLEEKQEK